MLKFLISDIYLIFMETQKNATAYLSKEVAKCLRPAQNKKEYLVFVGEDGKRHYINDEEGLKGTLEELRNNEKFRIALIHWVKKAEGIGEGVNQLLRRGYMVRSGTKKEIKKGNREDRALLNFAKVLKEQFPNDWEKTTVKTRAGTTIEPKMVLERVPMESNIIERP